jgi:glycosyltransferase involved in cell wall biosynthesis
MNRARVLLLIKALSTGGAEKLLVNAARYRNETDFDYEAAYILPQYNALVPDLERSGLRVHCLGGGGPGAWVWRLRALVRQWKPKIVHIHSPYAAVGARPMLQLSRGPRLVYTEHSVWDFYHPLTRRANALTFPLNNHVFAVSEYVRRSIRYPRALSFLPMPPIETLYHGIDQESIGPGDEENGLRASLGIPRGAPVVGTVGNFRVEKGHKYFLEAAAFVHQRFPEARFVLVGHGPLDDDLRLQARHMGLEPNVIFTGSRSDGQRLTASFDVFVLSSVYEGLSIALIEAMAVGTPIVATRTGGVNEVLVHGETGLLVPISDSLALSEAILLLLKDRSLQDRLAKAGKLRAAGFDIRAAVRRIEDVYRGLLG